MWLGGGKDCDFWLKIPALVSSIQNNNKKQVEGACIHESGGRYSYVTVIFLKEQSRKNSSIFMHFGDQNYHHLNVIWTNTIQQIPISTEWYVALKADGWENT